MVALSIDNDECFLGTPCLAVACTINLALPEELREMFARLAESRSAA